MKEKLRAIENFTEYLCQFFRKEVSLTVLQRVQNSHISLHGIIFLQERKTNRRISPRQYFD